MEGFEEVLHNSNNPLLIIVPFWICKLVASHEMLVDHRS